MTKRDFKRLIRIDAVSRKYKSTMMLRMLIVVLALFTAPAVCAAVANHDNVPDAIVMMGSSTVLAVSGMAAIGNIDDTSDQDASGKQIAYQVWLISLSQVDQDQAFPQPNMNREIGTIPLLSGEYMHYFEAHVPPTDDSKYEQGDFAGTNTNTFVLQMAGNRDAVLNFIESFAGGKFIIIYRNCESNEYRIMGNPCKPMILKSTERANNADKRGVTLTFENTSFKHPFKYVGAIVKSTPVTLAAGATTLAVVPGKDVYIVPNGSSAATPITAVSGLTANDKGRTITLIGSCTDKSATIEDGSAFVLEGGATWTGKEGSRILFKVLDTTRLVEVMGSRVQTA